MKIKLNKMQGEVIRSKAIETHALCGLGAGKSFMIGLMIVTKSRVPGFISLVCAPTKTVLRDSTKKQIKEAWDKMGLVYGVDYVENTRPPVSWGVDPYDRDSNHGVITFRWGSYVVYRSLDNPDGVRGIEADAIYVDEFRDVKDGARDTLLGRRRGKRAQFLPDPFCKYPQVYFVTTPPDNPRYYINLIEKDLPDVNIIHFPSTVNETNLPDGYIESLRSVYDEKTYEREVLGKLVRLTDMPYLYSFVSKRHVKSREISGQYWLSFDFNKNPLCMGVAKFDGKRLHVMQEFEVKNADIDKACDIVGARFPGVHWLVTGDASGGNKSILQKDNMHAWLMIQRNLKLSNHQMRVRKKNISLKNSRYLCNSVLSKCDVSIDAKCKGLIQDCETSQVNEEGDLIKDRKTNKNDHLDWFRYLIDACYPDFLKVIR